MLSCPFYVVTPYRAIDKHGEAVDFLLTAKRNLDAAKRSDVETRFIGHSSG